MKERIRHIARNLGITAGFLAVASLLCYSIHDFGQPMTNSGYVSMIFILAVFLASRFTDGYVYGIVASVLGVLGVNYVFTYPYMAFNFTLTGYPIAILSMLVVSIVTSAMMTEVKKSQERRMEAEMEKMRGDLLRAVSHDIRTPLTSVLGTVTLLEESEEEILPEERKALLRGAKEDIQWLINMVVNLLTVTRIEGGSKARIVKQPEYMEEMIPDAVRKFRKRFPQQEVRVRVPEDPFPVPMDAILMEQVLINLMENAVIHGERGEELRLEISAQEGEGTALITVRDNGVGIRGDLLRRINKGKTVDPETGDNRRNMGIGLSVCYTIIRAHGGEMIADNAEGGGAEFTILLPLEKGNRDPETGEYGDR